jgi:hypothetical protein
MVLSEVGWNEKFSPHVGDGMLDTECTGTRKPICIIASHFHLPSGHRNEVFSGKK